MNNMTWTKFSERLPEHEADEVFVIARPGGAPFVAKRGSLRTWKDWSHCYAWHFMTYPEVPKEETQREKDEAILRVAWGNCGNQTRTEWSWFADGFFSALRYERAEVAKELVHINPGYYEGNAERREILNRLRRRVGLDK